MPDVVGGISLADQDGVRCKLQYDTCIVHKDVQCAKTVHGLLYKLGWEGRVGHIARNRYGFLPSVCDLFGHLHISSWGHKSSGSAAGRHLQGPSRSLTWAAFPSSISDTTTEAPW